MRSTFLAEKGEGSLRTRKSRISCSIPCLRVRARRSLTTSQSGQALILAVVIMLLLVFLGTIFLRTVLSNLGHAERSQAASNEYSAAEAGIKFADTNLTSSELAADWRPRPSYNIAQIKAGVPTNILQRDPDWYWIQPYNAGTAGDPRDDIGGYIRYNLGDSRFLLRVTYNPENVGTAPVMPDVDAAKFDGTKFGPTALSRFVMIEAIGRRGSAAEIDQEYQDYISKNDPIDPTVFAKGNIASSGAPTARFRRELIAFKAIGINNYLRFVTDRDHLNRPTYLGVDQTLMRDGNMFAASKTVDLPYRMGIDADAFGASSSDQDFAVPATGSPIRVNGDLVWYGQQTPAVGASEQPEVTVNLTDEPWNVVEVAGEIRREGKGEANADAGRMALRLFPAPGAAPAASKAALPLPASSDTTAFTNVLKDADFANRYLDNRWLTATPSTKQTLDPRRSIRRLEPPQLEATDPASGTLRYEVMTRNTGSVLIANASERWRAQAAARYGYGAGIYVDNARHNSDHTSCRGDIQFNHDPERLRNEWLRPYAQVDQSGGKTGWVFPGRVYSPPGVQIVLENDWSNPGAPGTHGLIRMTRTDYRGWRDPSGNRVPVQTMFFELQPSPNVVTGNSQEYTLLPKYWDGGKWQTWDWDNNKWVDASGAKASWRYPFNGVIYSEGNVRIRGVLPQDTADGGVRLTVVSRGTTYIEGNVVKGLPANPTSPERSEIALLSRDYVTLNTTQLLQVQTDFSFVAGGDNGPPYYWRLPVNEPERTFTLSWDFGVSPDPKQDMTVAKYYDKNNIALFMRQQSARGPATIQWHVNNAPYMHLLGLPFNNAQDFYPLMNAGAWEYFADGQTPSQPFYLFPKPVTPPAPDDQKWELYTGPGQRNSIRFSSYDPGTAPDGSALTGGDYNLASVAIQPLDVAIKALIYAEHQSWFVIPGTYFQDTQGGDPEPPAAARYPKNREPLDIQINVIGAIAEGRAASLQDATEWTAHWRGANRTDFEAAQADTDQDWTFSRRGGINYAFDPALITSTREVRYSPDEPTYFLPGLPRLPMCPDLVYFGERPVQ